MHLFLFALMPFLFGKASSAPVTPFLVAHTGSMMSPSGGTTSAINTTGATFIVVSGAGSGTQGQPPTVSDSKGNTYTSYSTFGVATDIQAWRAVCYSPIVGTSHTFTIVGNPNNPYSSLTVLAFGNFVTSAVDQSTGVRSGTGTPAITTAQSGSITPTGANALVVATLGFTDNATITIDSGYAITDTILNGAANNYGSSAAYKVLTTASAQNPTWTASAVNGYMSAGITSYLPSAPPTTPTLVAHTVTGALTNSTATTSAINTTGATFIVVSLAVQGSATGLTLTDSKGNTWSALSRFGNSTDVDNVMFFCYSPTVGTGHTFSFSSSSGSFPSMEVAAFSGITTTSINTSAGATTASTSTAAPGSITPSTAHTLVLTGLGFNNNSGGAVSVGSSFTIIDTIPFTTTVNYGSGLAYKILSSASAQNPTWNITTSAIFASAGIVAFQY